MAPNIWRHACGAIYIYIYIHIYLVVFNPQTPCAEHIRGYNARELILAHVLDYWASISDAFTPPEMTGDRFRKTERIKSRTNNRSC